MSLADHLRALGLKPGQLVIVHGSLRALGLAHSQGVDGGADLILDAIAELRVGSSS